MPYLSTRALGGLKQYEYKSGGYTWLDDLHQPFWNWVTAHLPLWLAPNVITLIGLAGLLVAYIVAFVYLPGFAGEAPAWVYFLGGTAAVTYLHLDCIDGKQARRTQSSSPLGQLFDHGCDALAVHLLLTTVACSLNLGGTWKAVAGSMFIMVPWGFAHWEEYHDGTMLYGNGVWGITEANYALVILHYITCVTGPQLWDYNLQQVFPSLKSPLPFSHAFLVLVGIAGCQQLGGQIWRMLFTAPSVRYPCTGGLWQPPLESPMHCSPRA
ncbi:hypothetical protein WJX73_008786 [Symbiochloris irregularis]|uniref:Ethanolaminephosphotransferase n=1 Tax=Symbiochloris irregularis TaxID=706552 RepID=A0AAW1NRV5_9CHLO